MGTRTRILVGILAALAATVVMMPVLAATKTVTLTVDNKFVPGSLTVAEGDTVNFKWEGGFHDVTFSDGTSSGSPMADTGVNFSRTFAAVGTYTYFCSVHQSVGMTGKITVQAAGSTTGTDPTSMPFTGPETEAVPIIGAVLLILGGLALVRSWRVRYDR